MDSDKFKSVAINIDTYNKLGELSQKQFEIPISMSKTVEYHITKAYEDFKKNGSKKSS